MLKFDQQIEFEKEFSRRYGTEIFEPGGIRNHVLNSIKRQMMVFCINWMHDHVLTASATRIVIKKEIVYQDKIVHRNVSTREIMTNDLFLAYLKDLQLYAVKHEDAMTAKEINRKIQQFVVQVYPQSEALHDTDTDI